MKVLILMGSPRLSGNTVELSGTFSAGGYCTALLLGGESLHRRISGQLFFETGDHVAGVV